MTAPPWSRRRFRSASIPGRRRRQGGQGNKFHNHECYYHDGRLHPICPEAVAHLCDLCPPRYHRRCRTKNERLHCALCFRREQEGVWWFQSGAEGRTAKRLDEQLAEGGIRDWRRARPVVLQEAIPGQRKISYTADFVVTFNDDSREVLEVKGSAFVIADDARLKIKWYRALARVRGWPPLRVLSPSGAAIHV